MHNFSRGLNIIFILAIIISLSGASSVRAAPALTAPHDVTITVTTLDDVWTADGLCSLREAILAANLNVSHDACPAGDSAGMDTIVFAQVGVVILASVLPEVEAAGPLTIDGGSAVTISGNNMTNILKMESGAELTLRNLTITAGYLSGNSVGGAGLFNYGGTVTIDSCSFQGHVGSGDYLSGGAIHNENGSLTVSNSTFQNNTLSGNYAYGAAIYNATGDVTVISSNFFDNSVSGSYAYGGAIYNSNSNLYIETSSFIGNSAEETGGAIYDYVSTLEISNSSFQDNIAYWGGAIIQLHGTLTSSGNTFDSNAVTGSGGAIACYYATCTLQGNVFTGNIALQDGGAAYFHYDTAIQLDGILFIENTALNDGGAIAIQETGNFNITNTTFEHNTASQGGGAVITYSVGLISDSLFRQNYADLGGGIYNYSVDFANSGLTVERTTFWENNAVSGGALYNENTKLVLINDTLASNTAGSGGGAYNAGGGLLEIFNSTLAHNSATAFGDQLCQGGGAVYTANSIYAYGGSGQNCYGLIMDSGYNLDSGDTCAFAAYGSLSNTDPLLGPLQDNNLPDRSPGYPTLTFALHYPSPAISSANPSLCPATDQREYPRRSGYCDIGSYEAQPHVIYINSGDWQSTDINTYFPDPLVIEAQDAYGNRLAGLPVTFYGPDWGASLANNYTVLATGADGFVGFGALANDIPGGWYEVDALAWNGVYTSFHLTNLAPPGWTTSTFLPVVRK
jgi:CSLREA domain-containing protein